MAALGRHPFFKDTDFSSVFVGRSVFVINEIENDEDLPADSPMLQNRVSTMEEVNTASTAASSQYVKCEQRIPSI